MSVRTRLALLCVLVLAVSAVPVAHVWGAAGQPAVSGPGDAVAGKQAYRKFCGNCHALREALAAGFGGNDKLGEEAGPSFNWLKVSANLAVNAITEAFAGHDLVVRRMTWKQIYDCAAFVQQATRNHPYVARISDG